MVNSISNPYGIGGYAPPGTRPSNSGAADAYGRAANGSSTGGGYGASVNVTLSAEARAALAAQSDNRSLESVTSAARAALDKLLASAKATSALKDGRPTIDVSSLDRRSLYAVASNAGGQFAIEEQVVASLQMSDARDAVLKGPAAAARVTGDYVGLYQAWLANLDSAGAEEKASMAWSDERATVSDGMAKAMSSRGMPSNVDTDPVAAWLKANGGLVADPRKRSAGDLSADVRAALDRQYSLATDPDMATDGDSGQIDFSRFDDRSLALVALNSDDAFTSHEAAAAAAEVRQRSADAVSTAYQASGGASGGSAFGRSLISRYATMSDEERQASGWTPELYGKMVSLQAFSDKLASMFGQAGQGASGGGDGASSLLSYL